ncbi:MAG: ATP-binding protein [Truepera sp.]|nr:ATP-binding protein [Truepera sp.]
MILYLLEVGPWWRSLDTVATALRRGEAERALQAYRDLFRTLVTRGSADLFEAAAEDLLWCDSLLTRTLRSGSELPDALQQALRLDLARLLAGLRGPWQGGVEALVGHSLPPLAGLANGARPVVAELAGRLREGVEEEIAALLLATYRRSGTGSYARYLAFRWRDGAVPVADPDSVEGGGLIDVEDQLGKLFQNTEALLSGLPAHDVLLYGPRGSGKSTAVRSLLSRYGEQGLRLIEVERDDLGELQRILQTVAGQPLKFAIFVDDLSFDRGEGGYRGLRSLLEGSVESRPDNARLYATSNRRHLVRQSFSDRPDPLDDDVHAWDSHHENLALADRFGLTITFPNATQRTYLRIVEGLAVREGVEVADLSLRAVRYAAWGNGYSGRTARQFIDSLRAGLPVAAP